MENTKHKVLIVVDALNDFYPGGALPVPNGDEINPVINSMLSEFNLVIFTNDSHPEGMDAFASSHKGKKPRDTYINSKGVTDILWPDHCVQNTYGSELHPDIDLSLIKRNNFYIFKKGIEKDDHPYSGFGAKGLANFLKERKIEDVYIVGLATDYCAKDTALDSKKEGFRTFFVWDGCRGLAEDLTDIRIELEKNGVNIIDSNEFLKFHKVLSKFN